ncbi:MAG: spinster family MFS transporter [Hyphomonadaceae bacterium]
MAETAASAGAVPATGASFGTPSYRAYVLGVLTLVYTLNFIDRFLLSVIAQPVINAFNLSDTEYGFLNGPPFAIFYALMGIPLAMAADRVNRVVLIAFCIALWSVMAALCGLATSFGFLLIARIGVAIGEAGCTPPANSLIGDYFAARSRANALGIYAMGVTIGAALANAFGGPIATQLNGAVVEQLLASIGLAGAFGPINWAEVEGWRLAFILIGAPGVLVALVMWLTVKEPPRGFADPPGMQKLAKASLVETMRLLAAKPTFWAMAVGASLTALVGYGLSGFQAPMADRVHGISAGEFALRFGVPLSLAAAAGTFLGGFLTEKLSHRHRNVVTWLPAAGLLVSIPFYETAFFLPTASLDLALILWCIGAAFHYSYLGAQYTIGQGVVPAQARASAIAILLLCVALIGNGLGPQIVGWLSDMFMAMQLETRGFGGVLTSDICRDRAAVALLAEDAQAGCRAAYGEGLRLSMATTALIFIPAALGFLITARWYQRDLVAKPH